MIARPLPLSRHHRSHVRSMHAWNRRHRIVLLWPFLAGSPYQQSAADAKATPAAQSCARSLPDRKTRGATPEEARRTSQSQQTPFSNANPIRAVTAATAGNTAMLSQPPTSTLTASAGCARVWRLQR
eukprot:931648-Pleurochrysis_carterae.AAC.1